LPKGVAGGIEQLRAMASRLPLPGAGRLGARIAPATPLASKPSPPAPKATAKAKEIA
jgi:hypothetical protein